MDSCDLMNEKVKDCLPGAKEKFKSQHSDESYTHIMCVAFTFVSQVPSLQHVLSSAMDASLTSLQAMLFTLYKVCQLRFAY